MTSLTRDNANKSEGFVLVTVIWVLASLTLLVAFIATQLESMQNQSLSMEQDRVSRLDRLSVESTLLYLAATRTTSYAGLRTQPYVKPDAGPLALFTTDVFADRGDEIRLDGRAYKVKGGHSLRLQDAGSLTSLRSDKLLKLRGLLRSYAVERSEEERLISTLLDYIDRDEVVSVNGAERRAYESQSMLPPTNRFLSNPLQLYNVLGWEPYLDRLPGFFDEVTIYVADRDNYNNMTVRAMQNLGGVEPADAERLLGYRQDKSFSNLRDALRVSGGVFERDPLSVSLVPSRYLRMRLAEPDGRKEHWIGITLTPDSNLAPWEIDYRISRISSEKTHEPDSWLESRTPPTPLL